MGQEATGLRERIGLRLQSMEGRKCPHERAELAAVAEKTPRTLRNWKKNPRGGRPGRPPHALEKRAWSRAMALAELATLGLNTSAREIDRAIKSEGVPTILTREFVGEIKQAIRREAREEAVARRLHVEVLASDTIASADATMVCRESPQETAGDLPSDAPESVETPRPPRERGGSRGRRTAKSPCKGACRARRRRMGRAIQALMAVDVATTLKLGFKVVHAPKGQDLIDLLVAIRAERGVFPLVVATDNGPENVNEDVDAFLKGNRIIHLRNLPRTPRHNPHAERSHREVKAEVKLDIDALDPALALLERVRISIERAVDRLNHHRPRESRGWKTAAQLDNALPPAYTLVARDVFYAAASAAMLTARDSPGSARQKRLAERWALYAVMEAFGLIKLFRGGRPITALKAEGIT